VGLNAVYYRELYLRWVLGALPCRPAPGPAAAPRGRAARPPTRARLRPAGLCLAEAVFVSFFNGLVLAALSVPPPPSY